jgi:hypothetical protein
VKIYKKNNVVKIEIDKYEDYVLDKNLCGELYKIQLDNEVWVVCKGYNNVKSYGIYNFINLGCGNLDLSEIYDDCERSCYIKGFDSLKIQNSKLFLDSFFDCDLVFENSNNKYSLTGTPYVSYRKMTPYENYTLPVFEEINENFEIRI